VAIAAGALELQRFQRGTETLEIGDFLSAFLFVGAISLCSVPFFARLREDAGAVLAGPAPRSAEEGRGGYVRQPIGAVGHSNRWLVC